MKFLILAAVLVAATQYTKAALGHNLVCFYNAKTAQKDGVQHFSMADFQLALQFCTHFVYGYAGIHHDTFNMISVNEKLDIQQRHLANVAALKSKFSHIKFLLSVGGNEDWDVQDKYQHLLEAGPEKQKAFIESALNMVRLYNFDGLDLAFQLPNNKPRKVHSDVGMAWKGFKKFFTGDYIVDEKADEHKQQFTKLVQDLSVVFRANDLKLSLTVLPNVNSSWYYDAPALNPHLEFVNLAAFDFLTPKRNPEEADFTAPLYEPPGQNRLPHYNVNYQVESWLQQRFPANKINVGIPTYGNAWKMTKDSGNQGLPVVALTDGPAPPGPQSQKPGVLLWHEVCAMLPNPYNNNRKGGEAPIRRIGDPTKRYGSYAFRPADAEGEHGLWVSYEDPQTAADKAAYVKSRELGGVALFEINLDDYIGQCTPDKFPILRAIKFQIPQ